MSKVIVFAGSNRDEVHVSKITKKLDELGVPADVHYLSAHKNTRDVLAKVDEYNSQKGVVFITVAGKSNALSGVVACNTKHVVIACPPFNTTEDYMIDIHSTLRMPSDCPVLTVVSPENCALAVKRILEFQRQTQPKRRKRLEFPQDHPTKRIPLKCADVDVEMVPLVNWLNSYESIWTHFCCQGDPCREEELADDHEMHRPYILFTCISSIDLISVLSMFGARAETTIHWNEVKAQLEYCTRFHNQKMMFETIDLIERMNNSIKKRMLHGW